MLSNQEYESFVESLQRMALISAGERPRIEALTGGVSSMIVLAHTARGPVCVKRALAKLNVAAEWHAPIERSDAEVAWIQVASKIAPDNVPKIIGHDQAGLTFAMEYLDGDRFPVWKTRLRDGFVFEETARRVAVFLAAIHNVNANSAERAREFANDEAFTALRLDAYFAEAARRNADVAPVIANLIERTAATKRTLVHGDVSPKNILEGEGRIIMLDAETATYGDPAFDLAFCLNHLLLKCVWRKSSREAFLRCFEVLKTEYLGRVSYESARAVEARTCGLLAGMLLARVDGKSPVEYITDKAERDKVRQFAKARLNKIPDRLEEIRQRWGEVNF